MSEVQKDIVKLVIARLQTLPENQEISIGSAGKYNKAELIEHVQNGDKIGNKIIEVELHYLQSLKNISQSVLDNE